MIRIENVSKVFNAGNVDEVSALKNVSLQIEAGSFVVIVGSNGSGKSTLLNLILGSFFPSSGNIFINDNNITQLPGHERSKWISMVFQNPANGTAPDLSILENFRLAALRSSNKTMKIGIDNDFVDLVREKIKKLDMGLEDKLNQPMGSLSGGQRQALTLLMGVMDKTDVLLMDEPTAALDPKSAQKIMELAKEINTNLGITIVLITHSLKDALQYGNRLLMFKSGAIVKDINEKEKQKLTLNEMYEWFL
jgi:putative ABC transport system ATP-binding protein